VLLGIVVVLDIVQRFGGKEGVILQERLLLPRPQDARGVDEPRAFWVGDAGVPAGAPRDVKQPCHQVLHT
jgi:hypothetical protein